MAEFEEIQGRMIEAKQKEASLSGLTSGSNTAKWINFINIVSYCMRDQRIYLREHGKYVDTRLYNEKYGTLPWYRTKALVFQYGFPLIPNTDKFDNGDIQKEDIEASQVIKYAAVNQGESKGEIIIKIATEKDNKLAPVLPEVKESIINYYEEIKVAGADITIINFLPDKLFLDINIYRDPLILDTNGVSKKNGDKPVEKALLDFMKELPFNGELILQSLIDKLQEVEGVKIVHLKEAKSSWIDATRTNDVYGIPTVFNVKRIPVSGYYELDNLKGINYVV